MVTPEPIQAGEGSTYTEEVGQLVVDELLEFRLLQLVLVSLLPGVLVEGIDDGDHCLLQLRHGCGVALRTEGTVGMPAWAMSSNSH